MLVQICIRCGCKLTVVVPLQVAQISNIWTRFLMQGASLSCIRIPATLGFNTQIRLGLESLFGTGKTQAQVTELVFTTPKSRFKLLIRTAPWRLERKIWKKSCIDQWITKFNHATNKGTRHYFLDLRSIRKKCIQPSFFKGGCLREGAWNTLVIRSLYVREPSSKRSYWSTIHKNVLALSYGLTIFPRAKSFERTFDFFSISLLFFASLGKFGNQLWVILDLFFFFWCVSM